MVIAHFNSRSSGLGDFEQT